MLSTEVQQLPADPSEAPLSPAHVEQVELFQVADAVVAKLEAKQSKSTVPRKLLSLKQAADALGRSVGSVRHLIASGEIPPSCVKRIGRRVFLVESRLDKFIETL